VFYELLVLGRLMYGPHHGYLIAAIIGEMIGPWQKVSAGSLYPLLARLERDGLIMATRSSPPDRRGPRSPRSYAITEDGRVRFRALMLDVMSSPGDYERLLHLKVAHLEFLQADERVALLEHYRDYCRAAVRHREKNARDLAGWLEASRAGGDENAGAMTADGFENAIKVTRHMAEHWQAELAWTEQLLASTPPTR